MFWTRRRDHVSSDDLSAFADGELSEAKRASIATHVDGCAECRQAVEELRNVKTLVSRLPAVEAPRSFALTPQMAGASKPAPVPPSRRNFAFAPAVALTLFVALLGVDLLDSASNSSNDAGGEMASTLSKAEDSAAGSENRQSTFNAPSGAPSVSGTPNTTSGGATAPESIQPPPTVAAPRTGQGITPPDLTAIAGMPQPTPSAAANTVPAVPTTTGFNPPTTASVSPTQSPGGPGTSDPSSGMADGDAFGDGKDGGTDWLRVSQILVAVLFVVSMAYVFGPSLMKKGS